ncbi:MAG: perosamine synthetase [Candidatus Peregrinibacteria bacterium Greene0416_19]|nr:MAG: perosamine synthetase [Candidatus Peregrinibacteria bacterium Greene0416_19]
MHVPVNEPLISAEAKAYVNDALDTGWISSSGPSIDRFERTFADYLGVKHAVTTMNGTTALHLALATLDIGPGDEVIVPDFTMIASVAAVLYTGALPVFVDADPETWCMDVSQIEGKITPKTKAIMPVHIYGHPCDMDPVLDLAKRHGLTVVEDAAEAHGAAYNGSTPLTAGGRLCGSMGRINAFSFYANKIITTGEGGMVVTDDDALAARARSLKDLAHSPGKRFWHEELGYNYRMTNLQAAVGLGQLENVASYLAHKKWMAAEYGKRLSKIGGIRLPVTKPWATNVYWMYGIVIEESFGMTRDQFRDALKEKGVDTRDFFYSSATQPMVRKLVGDQGPFPVSQRLGECGLYLPSGLALTQEQIEYVCDAIQQVARAA